MKTLTPTYRALHNILHSQLVDHNYADGIIPLRSLYEMVKENKVSRGRVDWLAIQTLVQRRNREKVLQTYLYLAARLFDMSLPTDVRLSPSCHWYYLRCRAQLAWDWAQVWGIRVGSFSEDRIRKRYVCENGWIAVNRARLQDAVKRISAYARRRTSLAGKENHEQR